MSKKETFNTATKAAATAPKPATAKKTVTIRERLRKAGRVIAAPFRWIAARVRAIDVMFLTNMALLLIVIASFTILIANVVDVKHDGKPSFMFGNASANNAAQKNQIRVTDEKYIADAIKSVPAQPAQKIVLPLKPQNTKIVASLESKGQSISHGDIIIDGRGHAHVRPMSVINGNLILQNMHRYTLPCGIKVNGHMIIRNVKQLNFCDCFHVTGNIYVSPNSSFGPLPRDAIIGGQIIL